MIPFSLTLTALLIVSIAIWMLSRTRAVIPSVVLINYAVVLPLAGAISFLFSSDTRCSESGAVVLALIWLVYGCVLAIILLRFRKVFSLQRLKDSVLTISEPSITSALAAWWLVKIWLYVVYGNDSIRAFQVLPESDMRITYLENTIDLIANQFLVAALMVLVLRAAWNKANGLTMALGGITLSIAILVGDISVGSRRAFVMLIVLYLIARVLEMGYRRCLKELLIIGTLGVGVFLYYPLIRFNITDPVITDDVFSSNPEKIMKGIGELLTPNMDAIEAGGAKVFREGVAQLYCRLNDAQISGHSLAWGVITGDAVYIALPAIIAPNKSEKDPDARLAETYDLYPQEPYISLDLSANPLLQLQADFGFVAFPMAVTIHALLLIVGCAYLIKPSSTVRKFVAASLLWFVINSNEASLTQLIVAFRDFLMLSVMIWFLEVMARTREKQSL